jgi:hypothetical protein
MNLLVPGSSEKEIHSVPVSETEQPGVGGAIGGAVGAALGIAGGFELGAAATALIPGVGPVLAFGLAGAALLGFGGAAGGTAIGNALDDQSTPGLPADEVFFYEDALRQGRSVLVLNANGHTEAERARELMTEQGAESLDAARDAWWIGLQDAEREHYRSLGNDFDQDKDAYRAGFVAALRPENRDRSYESSAADLQRIHPDIWESSAFRHGFERGQSYRTAQIRQ